MTTNPDRAQVRDFSAANLWHTGDADVRRLQDEVAYLTRDRNRWRERAFRAEVKLAERVGCGGAA
jgi:hypothetical protein